MPDHGDRDQRIAENQASGSSRDAIQREPSAVVELQKEHEAAVADEGLEDLFEFLRVPHGARMVEDLLQPCRAQVEFEGCADFVE